MEPVELYMERQHAFKKKSPHPVTGKKRLGCEVCGLAKRHVDHLGAPPSLNEGGSGLKREAYQTIKGTWKDALRDLVRASALGALDGPLESVHVEAQVGFFNRQERDEGNLEWMLKKALGDVLVEEGVLVSDCFYPVCRYTLSLEGVHSPGRSWLRLLVFPRAAVVAPMGAKGTAAETRAEQLGLGG